jgi:hypothetical protein
MKPYHLTGMSKQDGVATLPISLILLVLLTLITVYAARVGVLETRTSANKQRTEQAFSAAEAAIEQTFGFVGFNRDLVLSDDTGGWMNAGSTYKWGTCPSGDAELPCSSSTDRTAWLVIKNIPSLTLTNCTDNDSNNTGGADGIPDGLCDDQTTYPNGISNAFGEHLYVHLMSRCRDADNNKTCDDATPRPADYPFITIVAGGQSADESGQSQIMQTMFFYDQGSGTAGAPAPLVAGGSFTGSGGFEIVSNPDVNKDKAGSIGSNKVAIWAKENVTFDTGSKKTCREGNPGSVGYLTVAVASNTSPSYASVEAYVPTNDQVVIIRDFYSNGEDLYLCRNCTCPSSLSEGAITINGDTEEDDILDIDSNYGKWLDTTFPDDLFMLFTGTPQDKWRTFKASLAAQGRVVACGDLGPSSKGWYWIVGPCAYAGGSPDIGGPNNIVRVVIEKPTGLTGSLLRINSNIYVWGVFFAFDPDEGNIEVDLNGSPTFYGSLMSNTSINPLTGNYKARYLPELFEPDPDSLDDSGLARLPGSWRDY